MVKILFAFLCLLSRLPLRLLYALSDVAYFFVYHVARYRRVVVRSNLVSSLPERSAREIGEIERRFYHFFCDYIVETLKLLTISRREMQRRLVVEGMQDVEASLAAHPMAFVYLGHYGNWEWISSLPLHCYRADVSFAQIYRPLNNRAIDARFEQLRTRFGAHNISKYDAPRALLRIKHSGKRFIVGFISDQSPSREHIQAWAPFLHHDTALVTGAERLVRR